MTVDDIKNFQCCNHSDILAIPPPISSSKPVLQQYFECEICKVLYKTKRGLTRHQNIVQKYNIRREGLYILPSEAIDQFKADLVHIIGSKLKEHFKQSGKQSLFFPCLESLFFGVFEGDIHYFNYKSGSYKCFFQGPDAYTQLATLLNNQNWGRKYFDNNQQTFVLLFNGQAEEKVNCNLFEEQILKYRKKRSNLPKLTVEWKTKSKRDAKDNQTSAGYIHLSFYTQQI
ncbi:hypothetical protein RhiirA1_494463 [Rhizophagus irregularis]|uniref:C2H2-type domain-containing protein n=1 Tax=Rhizophagus irregularis TaxID=588596 RepID=A0A2N0R6D8_9GLOM|nr:hypothetical protein RhiirA1_403378 [Rhizophagus irregularis]PKC58865.1 hypothetical protein RhiirA1_494463 [Rhizophagus irregularis]